MFKNFQDFKNYITDIVGEARIEHIGIGLKKEILYGKNYDFEDEEDSEEIKNIFSAGYMLDWCTFEDKRVIVEWQSLELIILDYVDGLKNINNKIESERNKKQKSFVYYVAIKDTADASYCTTFEKTAFIHQNSNELGGFEGCTCFYFKS